MLCVPSLASSFLLLICPPPGLGRCYVTGLPLLGSAGQKNHEFLSVGAVVDAIAWTEVDSKLGHAPANPLVIAEISKFDPVDPRLDARPNFAALALQPLAKVVRTVLGHIVDYFDQDLIVAYWLQDRVAIAKAHADDRRRFPVSPSAPRSSPSRMASGAPAVDSEAAVDLAETPRHEELASYQEFTAARVQAKRQQTSNRQIPSAFVRGDSRKIRPDLASAWGCLG